MLAQEIPPDGAKLLEVSPWNPRLEGQRSASLPWIGMSLFLAVAGLLAAMAFSDSHALERQLEVERIERDVSSELARLQHAVLSYRSDHGRWPGTDPYCDPSEGGARATSAWLVRQLLLCSDDAGRCAYAESWTHPFGPYLWGGMPINPVNGLSNVRSIAPGEAFPADPDGESGWLYDPSTGRVRANCEGLLQREGTRFYDL